jgi:DNA-binding transcriptional LysR family regulator
MNCSDSYDSGLQWFGMDVRNLEVFLSVAKHLNFTRAGEEVNLTQPSVSVRIRQLENEVGLKLFEQLGKKVALTEAGLSLIPHARRVMAAIEDARQCIQELQGLERGSLRIGASTTPGMYLIPKAVALFKRRHPNIEIHLRIKDTRQVEAGVLNNEFDFGFVGGHLVGHEVAALPWLTDQLVLIVPPDHEFVRRKSIKPKHLQKQKFILREVGSATRATIVNHLQNAEVTIEPIMEMENPESVKKAVQSGLGIAFISRFAVETELKAKSLVAVRVSGLDIRRQLKIVYRKDKHLGRAAQTFIHMATK